MKDKSLETIEGAQEFLQELQAPLNDLDSKIQKLKEKIKEVETEMDSFDPLTVEGITGSMEKRVLLENLEAGVKKAEAEKIRIIESNFDATIKGTVEIMGKHSSKVIAAYQEENKLIIRKVNEIREIYDTLRRDQIEAEMLIRDFRVDLIPYLKPNNQELTNKDNIELDMASRVNIFDKSVDDLKTGVKGLKPNFHY